MTSRNLKTFIYIWRCSDRNHLVFCLVLEHVLSTSHHEIQSQVQRVSWRVSLNSKLKEMFPQRPRWFTPAWVCRHGPSRCCIAMQPQGVHVWVSLCLCPTRKEYRVVLGRTWPNLTKCVGQWKLIHCSNLLSKTTPAFSSTQLVLSGF